MYTDFYTKGHQVFNEPELASQIPIEQIQWMYEGDFGGDNHPSNNIGLLEAMLEHIHHQIELKYIAPYFEKYSVDKRRIWEGVNNDATSWHNDLNEGPNCFFLLYFSDMVDDGSIGFKNKNNEWFYYPKRGTMVAVNCAKQFLHKATKSAQKRVISSFCFNLDHSSFKG